MSNKTYQQQQLEATPERVIPFLRAIATNQQIRFAMASAGYGDEEQAEGWQLLLAATGYAQPTPSTNPDADARQAITELDNWDETGFRRIHAALERLHPTQDAFVFAGLEATRGPGAVLGVAKLLDRLDSLEKGTTSERAAIATLDKRGINATLRQHLRHLIALAQSAKPIDAPVMLTNSKGPQEALEKLFAWYRDWSETARSILRRRDHLILLGLAKRRSKQDDGVDIEEVISSPSGQGPATTSSSGSQGKPTSVSATAE